jgi:hypothetical protein
MGSTKHEKSFVDFEMPYERNIIGMRGIVYFAIGLFLLIVITFGLMWALLNVLEDEAKESKKSTNPMAMSEKDRLPPEPRLQLAPGFGIDSPEGRVNLELRNPQAEYREFHKQWLDIWENGHKDPKTGAVTMMPIEEAKAKVLTENLKAKSGEDAEKLATESRMSFSDASAGRVKALKRR